MNDKILKALEGLKFLNLSSIMDSTALKKEKVSACVLLADQMSTLKPSIHSSSDLTSRAIEGLINLCDDNDADVRAAADESLNRVIRILSEWSVLSVQTQLFLVIKKNGSKRCVRTALTKFAALVGKTNPCKGRAFAVNLIPCLVKIAERSEESLVETLGKALELIWPVMGKFSNYVHTKNILKAFLNNLSSENMVIRRTSASSLVVIVLHTGKPEVFATFVLNCVMDKVVPMNGDTSTHLLQGVLNTLRGLIPILSEQSTLCEDSSVYVDKQLQIYELCLHCSVNKDHNVVTGSLEALNVLLNNPNRVLKNALLNPGGITRNYIHCVRQPSRLWSRTASEISVAGSITAEELLLDDGDLSFPSLVIPEQTSYTINRLRSLSASAEDDGDSDPESVLSEIEPAVSVISKELPKEEFLNYAQDDFESLAPEELQKEIDVGSFTDPAVPLLFCARRLATFLLDGTPGGLRSDKHSRVSVKSIAISCLTGVLHLCPHLLSVKFTPFSDCEQKISDVLLLSQHSDPQIRGVVCVLIGSFLNACLVESKGRLVPSLDNHSSPISIHGLLAIVNKCLSDSSPAASRLALSAAQLCLNNLLCGSYYQHALSLLSFLPDMAKNEYWLNKVRLIETLANIDYITISEITGNTEIQTNILEKNVFAMLCDVDGRVRRTAAQGIVNIIQKLCTKESACIAHSDRFGKIISEELQSSKKRYTNLNLSLPFCHLQTNSANNLVEPALSKIVAKLTLDLTTYTGKYQLYGILEALRLLSEKYPPVVYPSTWQCDRQTNAGISCLLPFLVALVTSNTDVVDLACLENITALIANLYAGNAVSAMKSNNSEISSHVSNAKWLIFGNSDMGRISENFLTHLLTVLNIYTQLQDTTTNTKPHGRIFQILPSKKGEREEISHRVQPHYLKLHQTLRYAFSNYKMNIDDSASENFLSVLSATLLGLSTILETSLPTDSARIAEEVSSYMLSSISMQPGPTLTVTLQLFRSLFSVNLPHYWTGLPETEPKHVDSLYANIFGAPEQLMSERSRNVFEWKLIENTQVKKQLCLSPDKQELVSYLKILENIIIKALQMYTKTPDTEFQCIALTLLTQMVDENIKYSHLDEKLVFVGFVKKQLELIGRGQISNAENILEKIFKFFVCLSSEKQNSKPMLTIPDILQLFLDLVTSDQPKETHCVPGFLPVVVEVFSPRTQLGDDRKEKETQREVLLANMLRLAMHREIFDALSYVVNCNEQTTGKISSAVLSLLADGQIKLEDVACRKSLSSLFCMFPASTFQPADQLLQAVFSEPRDQGEIYGMVRWLATETILLESLFQLKEDSILLRVQSLVHPVDLCAFLAPPSTRPDPLLVAPPSQTFPPAESLARFVLLSISRSAVVLLNNPIDSNQLEITLSGYFVVIFHFLQSGNFRQTGTAMQDWVKTHPSTVSDIYGIFLQLSSTQPLIMSQFLNLIGLLQCVDPVYWIPPLTTSLSFFSKIIQKGAILALSDYLCENSWDVETLSILFTACDQVLELYEEAPVKEVLTLCAQRSASGPIILEAINSMHLSTAKITERALRVLRLLHSDYTGCIISVLATKFLKLPYFALCRVASSQACRRLEFLLLQPQDQVLCQLSVENFRRVRISVNEMSAKYAALANLVKKVGEQFYNVTEEKFDLELTTDNLEINQEWFFTQVKQLCCQRAGSYREAGPLLIKLDYPFLKKLFELPNFQILVLGDCFLAVESFVRESNGKVELEGVAAYKAAREATIELIGCSSVVCEESDPIWNMARILTIFLDQCPKKLTDKEMTATATFAMHCLHKISEGLVKNPAPSIVEAALSCVRALLDHCEVQAWLNRKEQWTILETALTDCVSIVRVLVPDLPELDNGVMFLVEFLLRPSTLPEYLGNILKRTVVLLCRLLPFWSVAVGVPEAGEVEQEVLNLLKEKIKILGWTNRAQFEEIWAAFLVGFSQSFGDPCATFSTRISALQGIAVLMEEALLTKCGDPGTLLIDRSRDFSLLRECASGAPRLSPDDGFFKDLEAVLQPKGYRVSLYSVEHLWSASQLAASSPDSVASDSTARQQIADIGLDLTSCLHFLLEVYSQWVSEVQDQCFLAEALKTSLILSDQFTDPSQFRSLLNIVLAMDKSLQSQDLPLLPFCILITSKCLAALLPGMDQYEKLMQMMTRSDSPSAKLATIQALLFLVQSPVVYWKLQPTRQLGNSMFYVEDNETVTQLVDTFIPYAIELLSQFVVERCSWSEIYEIHAWTLLVYLLIHYRREIEDNRKEFIKALLSALAFYKGSHATQTVILHGTERLLLADALDEDHVATLYANAQLLIGHPEPQARRNGYQLLLTTSFISKRSMKPQCLDPDSLMAVMERLGLLLGRLRKAVPGEAAQAALALRYLLRDLQPLDVLTKLIQEFLSPHHPYTNILASLLFQVMEGADLPLLQDWVVFSLPSLVHNVPVQISSRTLTCLFLSACRDPWLRAVFPLTQNRHRNKEAHFPQLLIVAAAHFFSQLNQPKQQEEFRNVFVIASKNSRVYNEILKTITFK